MEEKKSKIGINILLLFLLIYIFFMSGHMGGDSLWIYFNVESIVLDGNLDLNDHPDKVFNIKELESAYQNIINSPKTDENKLILPYGIGLVVFEIPFFIIGYLFSYILHFIPRDYVTMFFTSMINCFICSLLCYCFFKICKLFNFSDRISVWLTFAFGLGSLVFPYSRQGYLEPLATLSLLGTVYLLLLFFKSNKYKSIILGGIFLGIGVLTRFDILIYLPFLFLYIFFKDKNIFKFLRNAALFSFPILIAVIIYFIYNFIRYGEYTNIGPQADHFFLAFSFATPITYIANIFTLFLSSGTGIIIYMPVIVLILWSIRYFFKNYLFESLLFSGFILVNVFFYSTVPNVYNYVARFSWGPRYSFVIIPYLFLPIGFLLINNFHRLLFRILFKFLVCLSVLFQLPSILVNSAQMEHLFQEFFNSSNNVKPAFDMLIYNPNFSPIINGYYQIISAFTNILRDYHLYIPIYDAGNSKIISYIPLHNVDFIDIWFANVLRILDSGIWFKILVITVIIVLICLISYLAIKITINIDDGEIESKVATNV
jgi:hypothetical protein